MASTYNIEVHVNGGFRVYRTDDDEEHAKDWLWRVVSQISNPYNPNYIITNIRMNEEDKM